MTRKALTLAAAEALSQSEYALSLGDRTTAFLWHQDFTRLTRMLLITTPESQS